MTFRVTLESYNLVIQVNENETILDAALRQEINLPYGCRFGGCGECISILTSGNFRYEEDELPLALTETDHAMGMIAICLAIPESDLSIEARKEVADTEYKMN